MAIGVVVLAVTLLYAEMLRRYGSTGLVDELLSWVAWSRDHLGAFPRPIETVLGVPALAWGCHMRARRRQGWWLCAFGVAATAPVANALVNPAISLANIEIDFTFTGRSSHAAAAPHLGRSALDAAELMNVGVNYMREHMPDTARIHYAMIDSGGVAPNVVQAKATVRYLVRAAELPELNPLIERVRKIAEGAALMTETKVESRVISAVSNLLGNAPLERLMHDNFMRLGPPDFDEADRQLAVRFQATLTKEDIAAAHTRHGLAVEPGKVLCDLIVPIENKGNGGVGSTCVGDVSWVVPTVQVHAPTIAIGTPLHTWQVVAQGKSPHAHKAMVQAAKAMAGLGVRALTEPELLAAAKADLKKRTARTPYVSPLPKGVSPPLDMSVS